MKINPFFLACTFAALLPSGVGSRTDWPAPSDLRAQRASSLGFAQGEAGRMGLSRPGSSMVPEATTQKILHAYGQLPLAFEENQGQTVGSVKFMSRGAGYTLYLGSNDAVLILSKGPQLTARGTDAGAGSRPGAADGPPGGLAVRSVRTAEPSAVLRMTLVGSRPAPAVAGVDEQPGKLHYFIGNAPKKWRTNLAHYARVKYSEVYPNVDLVYYGNQRQLEYDFIVKPGGDPTGIVLDFRGADRLQIDPKGDLLVQTHGAEIRMHKPVVYQEVHGARQAIDGRYILKGKRRAGFVIAAYDPNHPLIIDPMLSYSTFLGGSSADSGIGIAVDSSGNAYVTGYTSSVDFPAANPLQGTVHGSSDAFVTKFNSSGSALVYSTYLGGSGDEYGDSIAVDSAGNAYVTGYTTSTDFPTANPVQGTFGGGNQDAFVTKLNASGSALVYSTYLGGSGGENGDSIVVDPSGNAYVTGGTTSTDFPTANPLQGTLRGSSDAFVTKFNSSGSALVYSTYLGGSDYDSGSSIAVDSTGAAYVTGYTYSTDFLTANPLQATLRGTSDAFVTKFNSSGSALVYSTYLGGSGADGGSGIVVDSAGNAYVTGGTQSTDFPTANPLQGTLRGSSDAFVTKVNASGSALVYSTYLGGSDYDFADSIAVDTAGNTYVTGYTYSLDFPTANPLQGSNAGTADAFVTKVNASGSALVYSTYLGGSGYDQGNGIAVDSAGNAYMTGYTGSADFPSANPLQERGGGYDAFVTKITNQSSTTTVLASSANPSVYLQAVTFTATVSGSGGTPTGTVTFKDAGTTLGTATLNDAGQATLITRLLSVGTHSITASYQGSGNFLGSTSPALAQEVRRRFPR